MTILEILDKQKSHLNKLTMWAETANDKKAPLQIFPNDLLQYCRESMRQIEALKFIISNLKISNYHYEQRELEKILLGVKTDE